MVGRPSSYTQETADTICERIALGESLRSICAQDDMPDQTTVFRWLRSNEDFRQQYARAREDQADALFDECLDIADDKSRDVRKTEDGAELCNTEFVQRAKLRIDTRKWMAGKLRPKVYGDRQILDANIKRDTSDMSEEELEAELVRLRAISGS